MSQSRRQFLKTAAVGVAVTAVASKLLAEQKRGGSAPAQQALKLVAVDDPTAKALNYYDDKSKIKEASFKADRQGVKFADQKCSSCLLYKSAGKVGGVEAGSCTLFPGKAVNSNGWCSSWSKKA